MLRAIHAITKQPVNIFAAELQAEYMKNEQWLAPPSEITSCPADISKNNIEVKWRISHLKKSSDGKEYRVRGHFFIPNAQERGIITREPSFEHKLRVSIISKLIESGSVTFVISQVSNKETQELKTTVHNIPFENISWNEIQEECYVNDTDDYRIPDILIPFKQYDPLVGYGIAIEIQLTPQSEAVEQERSFDRASRGYGVVWVKPKDFIKEEGEPVLITDSFFVRSHASIINDNVAKCEQRIRVLTANYLRDINGRFAEVHSSTSVAYQNYATILSNVARSNKEEASNLIVKLRENAVSYAQQLRQIVTDAQLIRDELRAQVQEVKDLPRQMQSLVRMLHAFQTPVVAPVPSVKCPRCGAGPLKKLEGAVDDPRGHYYFCPVSPECYLEVAR